MRIATALFVSLLFCSASAAADEPSEQNPKYSAAAEQTTEERFTAIRQELALLGDHAWAGEYYHGDGKGVNARLALAPKLGYAFEERSCLGPVDRNYGTVTPHEDRLQLEFTFEQHEIRQREISPELVVVHWGPRHYLVQADNVIDFCNAVNAGSEPRDDMHGLFALRKGDEKLKANGFPAVPEKYKPYLLPQPIEAEIVLVGDPTTRAGLANTTFRSTPVTLNKGTEDGLLVRMTLQVTNPQHLIESVQITKESRDRSNGVILQMVSEYGHAPEAGWKLSTRAPWRDALARSRRNR